MALLFLESFDKYGPANSNSTAVAALLTAGEWTTATATVNIVAPLSQTGYAVTLSGGGSVVLGKTLPGNYSRLIGGFRFSNTLATLNCGVQFKDGASDQLAIQFNATGTFSVRNGTYNSGTLLGTSTASVTANTTHYLEFDITFGNVGTGSYQLWLDGISILSGSGTVDTTATANNYANGLQFICGSGSPVYTIDDFYIFDTTGATNNAVLLTSPRVETQFPTGDGAVQFAVGAGMLGSNVSRTTTPYTPGANVLVLRAFIPAINCTLNSVGLVPATTSGPIQLRGVVYADSSGAAGTLMSSGSTVTGTTSGTTVTLPLTTPQSLVAGTRYWLGFMADTSINYQQLDLLNTGYRATSVSFASGAPATAPAMTSGQATTLMWGNLSGITGNNWYCANQNPTAGSNSYVYDATVGHEDLYTYPALSAPPSAIYAVAVKASVAKSDAAKTVSVRLKSGATDSAGTGGTQAPGTSYGWLTSHFETDPNGNIAWTLAALSAAQSGLKIET